MVKLVATDLDGTLLDGAGNLPADAIGVFRGLIARGVRVVVASGRPYSNIRAMFEEIIGEISAVCDNGGMTYVNGQLLDKKPVSDGLLRQALRKIRMIRENYPVFCGVDGAYAEDSEPEFLDIAERFYPNLKVVTDLEETIGTDDICKITVYDAAGAAQNGYPALCATARGLRAVLSGEVWTDMSVSAATKGEGLRFLQSYFGVSRDECMAFGDYYNDLDMLRAAGESYAMANAPCDVKAAAKHVAPSNAENGVLSVLRLLLRD